MAEPESVVAEAVRTVAAAAAAVAVAPAPAAPPEPAAVKAPEPKESPLKGKRVLVTGACGFLGAHILVELDKAGAEPVPVDTSFGYDIRNEAEVLQALMLAGPDVVIHAAAPRTRWKGEGFKDILDMGRHLVHGCVLARARLVLVDQGSGEWSDRAHQAVYGMAAAYAEQTSDRVDGFKYCGVRLSDLFGPGNRDSGNPINQIIKVAIIGSAMNVSTWTLPGQGAGEIEALFVRDAARAVVRAAEDPQGSVPDAPFGIPGRMAGSADVVREALLACGQNGSFSWTGVPGPWDKKVQLKITGKVLPGWQMETTFSEAIRETTAWLAQDMREQDGKP